ncbi:hypothetical protein [Cognatiyoonia sp. IB215182]|uniref:hypothetical protein n=1 Tax=Cognatiyoonia sp. IB215182 TaxID=3097353 RepID=UPI002A0C7889|nr:hypothetical protein [Cognatiyoonia sp. IB215182]MDX8355415.1 hypothetical protein [Cognatiyoonia sp. IB215182]
MLRLIENFCAVLFLTILTQIGGIAWLIALFFRQKVFVFPLTYTALTAAAVWIAPSFGRVALNCFENGPLQVQSWMYCALNRNYVTPELREVLIDTAKEMDRQYPGTETLVLDASFPFLDGFPLLPHLSHDDGEKADLAFFYRDETGYLPGATRSPIGYFAFEPGPTDCTPRWPTLRWDFDAIQPLWRDYELDEARMAAVMRILATDARVGKTFIEPHLVQSLRIAHPRIRFQGCRAARHDDHIHFQL